MRLFEPGNRSFNAGVVGCAIALEFQVLFGLHDLARRGHNLTGFLRPLIDPPKSFQDCPYLVTRQPRTGRQAELPFHVIGGKQQDAMRVLPVAASPPGFLQIVFQ